jgi:hypothetical protein
MRGLAQDVDERAEVLRRRAEDRNPPGDVRRARAQFLCEVVEEMGELSSVLYESVEVRSAVPQAIS